MSAVPPTPPSAIAMELTESTTAALKKSGEVRLPVPAGRLFKWNVAMCLFHGAFAVVTLAVGKVDLRVPVYGSELGLEVLVNDTRGWKYAPEKPGRVGWLYLTWLVAIFFLLSSFAHLGNGLLWRKHYLEALAHGYAPFRWLEYCLSASVMVLLLAYVSGTVSQNALVMLFALTMITMAFGHLHEVICRPLSGDKWAVESKLWRLQAHFLGYIPQCFAWGVIIYQFLLAATESTTDSYGEKREMPKFVYGIVFGEVLLFWSFGVVQLVVSLRPPSKYYEGEIAYMWLSLIAKGFLGLLCLSNVIMAGGYAEIYEDE